MTMVDERPATAAGMKAKRGDLVVVQQHHHDFVLHGENRSYDTFMVGVVTSVTRDGQVKMYRRAGNLDGGTDYLGRPDRGEAVPGAALRVLVMSAKAIDVPGALATAACHVWTSGHESPMPYATLEEVRAALRPHRIADGAPWSGLHDAGAAWEDAHRIAAPMLPAALRAPREDFPALSAAYGDAIKAANDAYRAAYAATAS